VRRRAAPLVALLGAAAVVGGCGGPTPLPRAEFQRRANAACARADAAVRALPRDLAGPGDAIAVATLLEDTRPIERELVGRLAELTPPTADRSRFAELVMRTRAREQALAALEHAAATGDGRAAQRAAGAIVATSTEAIARGLGLPECARSVAPSG
jgi:hypothetical protein